MDVFTHLYTHVQHTYTGTRQFVGSGNMCPPRVRGTSGAMRSAVVRQWMPTRLLKSLAGCVGQLPMGGRAVPLTVLV